MLDEGTYRARGLGQPELGYTREGTPYVAALYELKLGETMRTRLSGRWYLNTEENAKNAVKQLRASGWRGATFRNWKGFGEVDCDVVVKHEQGLPDGRTGVAKTYPRIAFVNELRSLRIEQRIQSQDIDKLSDRFAHLLSAPSEDGEVPDDGGEVRALA